jgi:hypothetical protein
MKGIEIVTHRAREQGCAARARASGMPPCHTKANVCAERKPHKNRSAQIWGFADAERMKIFSFWSLLSPCFDGDARAACAKPGIICKRNDIFCTTAPVAQMSSNGENARYD